MAAVVNSSAVLLSILLLMVFGASSSSSPSLPPLHKADTLSPSDDHSCTFRVPNPSSSSPSLCLTTSSERVEVMRLETSDAELTGGGIIMVLATLCFLMAIIILGKTVIVGYIILPIAVLAILFFLATFR